MDTQTYPDRRRWLVRRCSAAALVGVVGALLGAAAAPAQAAGGPGSPECIVRTTPVPGGPAHLVTDKTVPGHGGRLHDLALHSPALDATVRVDVLLPRRYADNPEQRYHVLYLLHGSGGSYTDWIAHGVQQLLAANSRRAHLPPLITVMPEGGTEGYYTDWYGRDVDQPSERVAPGWATFDLRELIPYIDRHYRVITGRAGRAIAGLSMGGFGATSFAARAPDLFSVAGSFSGADDIDDDYPYENTVLYGTDPAFTGGLPDLCIWGDALTERVHWEAVDPTYLAANLAGVRLFIASGNGTPGPYDGTSPSSIAATEAAGAVERDIWQMNSGFVAALNAAHVAHTDYFYGPGTHVWPYWLRDLRHFLPFLADGWRHVGPTPTRFSFRSEATQFTCWGWVFTADRSAAEFTYLRSVTRHGFEIAAGGLITIRTPRDYRPGSRWLVNGRPVTADRNGRLRLHLTLPEHRRQQTSFPAGGALPSGWSWTPVAITPRVSA